jgi:PEP-CTERM motif
MRFSFLSLAAMSVALSSAPAFAGSVLFSDLGTGSNVYGGGGWIVQGSGAPAGPPVINATLFAVAGSGPQSVTQIDLAVLTNSLGGTNTFSASIWTDVSGLPGAQVTGASWNNLSTSVSSCCGLVSISGISALTLVGGQQYFLVLAPIAINDSSSNIFAPNTQGIAGIVLASFDGGSDWVNQETSVDEAMGAFDVLGVSDVPEPTSLLLSATGLAALFALRRRRVKP